MAQNDRETTVNSALARWPSPWQAWYTVALLGLLYIISWVDRNILVLLAQPVSQALGLDDRQMALLLGLGFALLYAIGGVLLGHFVDTRNRRTVATCGIILWSTATVLSAFATSFWSMLLLRCGVALGEAVLMPAAISLIADLFPRERRGLPVAVFTSIGGVMTIGSYAGGAAAIGIAGSINGVVGLSVWQTTLIIVGLPGFALALIFALSATVPARTASDAGSAREDGLGAVFAHFRSRLHFLGPLLSLTGITCIFSLAIIIWLPAVLIREHGITASQAGYLIAIVGVPTGLASNFFWQWCATRLQRRDPQRGILRTFIAPALLVAPCYAAGLLTNSLPLQLTGFATGLFMSTAFNVLTQIAIQYYTPPQMRARMVSVNFLIISVLGYGFGPLAAVEIAPLLVAGVSGLRMGLFALTLVTWPLLVIAMLAAVRNADGPAEHEQ
ncbi:MAG: MFS transporter [Sphingobium sp.]